MTNNIPFTANLVDDFPVAIAVADKTAQQLNKYNKFFFELFGWDLEDIDTLEKWFNNAYPDKEYQKEVIKKWEDQVNEVEENNLVYSTPFEVYVTCKDGSVKICEHRYYRKDNFIYGFFTDITQQKKQEQELLEQKEFLETLVDATQAIVVTIKPDGTMNMVNKYTETITGYTQDEIASKPYFWFEKFIPSDIQPDIQSIISQFSKNNTLVQKYENEWIIKNGERRLFEWTNSLVYQYGEPSVLSVGLDITEIKNKEADILKQKEQFQNFIEDLGENFLAFRHDMNGIVVYITEN